MQKIAEEVTRASTTSQPEQHTNNVNAKHKQHQAAPQVVVHRKPPTTTNKQQPHIPAPQQQFHAETYRASTYTDTLRTI